MRRRRTSLFRRLRLGTRRGAALPVGALFLVMTVVFVLAAWERQQEELRLVEIDRERGRIWAMTCTAVHRAVQSGRVTSAGTVTPAQLKGWSLLPAGLGTVGRAGGTVATAAYGAVMVDGVAMAACSLSGPELSFRAPALRAGAVMGGLDLVGEAGGEATAMHDRLPAVRAVLGALPAGSLFATADHAVGHDEDRLYRRPVGGRPELARMETDFVFGPNDGVAGRALLPASEIADGVPVLPDKPVPPGRDCLSATEPDDRRCFDLLDVRSVEGVDAAADGASRFAGARARIAGNVTVGRTGQPGSMAFGGDIPATAFRADGGFRFGHAGAPDQPFNIPQLLSVGTGLDPADPADLAKMVLAVEGEARADSLDLTVNPDASGKLDAGGKLEASGAVRAATLSIGGDMGANAASFTGAVTTGGCTGCEPPQVPQ